MNYGGLGPVVVKGLQKQQLMPDDIMKQVNNLERFLFLCAEGMVNDW